ncbi:MAG: tRNA (5-methylaminomethyl-2-thiouridine)(34)-methyltransferase MnmD [Planctomycetota bacterium]|nr:tRNA (5-methylaminomethyl-2-thiouridine)(34)-methyltransferase MnmD [Planctomycetota bacterium]
MSSEDGPSIDWARLEYLEDGTPFAARYDDVYCSRSGRGQAAEVFVEGNRVVERCAAARSFAILETGLGLGLNLSATLDALGRVGRRGPLRLRYAAIELHPVHPEDLAEVHRGAPSARPFLEAYPALVREGRATLELGEGLRVALELVLGDGAAALTRLQGPFDALYLDGFAPARNQGMWNPEVYGELSRLAAPGATLATYSAASAVREGLTEVGFRVERRAGFARKRHRIVGERDA